MKKTLLSLLMFIFILSSCESKSISITDSPKEALSKIQASMSEITSADMNVKVSFSTNTGGIAIDASIESKTKIDSSGNSYSQVLAKVPLLNITTETYGIKKDNGFTIYVKEPFTNNWYYQDVTKLPSATIDLNITSNLGDFKSFKYVGDTKINDHKVKQFEVVLSEQQVAAILGKVDAANGELVKLQESSFNGNVVANIFIDLKSSYIYKISLDLSNNVTINNQFGTISKLLLEITYDNFNNVDKIVVPEEVLTSAIKDNKFKLDFNASDLPSIKIDNGIFDSLKKKIEDKIKGND